MRYLASHENTTRGTSDFPLELYYVDMLHPRYEMPFHWHMECELLLVLQGEFTLLTDGQSYTLHPGVSAFLSSGADVYKRQVRRFHAYRTRQREQASDTDLWF